MSSMPSPLEATGEIYVLLLSDASAVPEELVLRLVERGYVTLERPMDPNVRAPVEGFSPDVLILGFDPANHDAPAIVGRYASVMDGLVITLFPREPSPSVATACLEAGADFCFSVADGYDTLVTSMDAALRRTHGYRENLQTTAPGETLRLGALNIDTARCAVFKGGEQVPLTPMEYRIVAFLADRPDTVCTTDSIVRHLHPEIHYPVTAPETIKTYIRRIRSKLEDNPDQPAFLVTVRGFGYMLSTRVRA